MISIACYIISEADLRRETQAERIARVRKLAEGSFRNHQEKVRKANKDRGLDIPDFGQTFGSDVKLEGLEREIRTGHGHGRGHVDNMMEANLARPQTGSNNDVRIPSRYRNRTDANNTNTTTSTSTTTTSSSTFRSTFTSFTTDSSGRASVNVSDYNLSDSEIHSRLTKEMAERRHREEKAQFQKDRQARKAREEAQHRATESMREQREKEYEAATRERKRKQKEWDRVNGTEETFGKKRRRDRRGSTPIMGSKYEYGSSDEDIEHTGTRYPGGGRGEGDGSGFVYEEFIGGSGSGSGSRGTSARYQKSIHTRKEREEKERERYISRWKSLLSTDDSTAIDGIIETELSYLDIPWPIYSNVNLEKGQIARFLSNIALIQGLGERSGSGGKEQDREKERRVLREAIRNFHPDRFNSKVLPRVREGEREKVKEGMEICSRVLTDLISQNASSR